MEDKQFNKRWWTVDAEELHEHLFGIVGFFRQNQSWREQMNLRNLRLYGDFKNIGLTANTYAQNDQSYDNQRNKLTLNIVKSICDTATNRIAKARPRPMFLTEGGSEKKQRQAKNKQKFVEGTFYKYDAYPAFQKMFLDSTVFGTGAVKIYRQAKDIKFERTFINELKVDEAEAINGNPRQLFQIRTVDPAMLASQFPDKEDVINEAEDVLFEQKGYDRVADQITVLEAWHLPSGKDATDGRHVIAVSSGVLHDEQYNKDHFPFIFQRWGDRLLGFWGYGIAEALTGIQYEINSLLQTIQMSMRLCSIPKVFVEVGSKVVPAHLNNEIGGIVFYSGTKPDYQPIQAVPTELFAQTERLVQRAYEMTGVSLLSAQAKKPTGLDAGVALREFNDIQSERFALIQQSYEQNVMKAAEYVLELGKEIYEEFGDFDVTVADNKKLERIKWSEIDMDKEGYILKVYPSSALPTTPAGKLEKVVELYQNGFLPQDVAFSLLEFPDIEAASNRLLADYQDIQMTIQNILDGGKYFPPEPYQNLRLGLREMQLAYISARHKNVSEDKLQKMRNWMTKAQSLMQLAAPPTSPTQPLAQPPQAPQGDIMPIQGAPAPQTPMPMPGMPGQI